MENKNIERTRNEVIEYLKKCIAEFGNERFPLLTLTEFFSGNTEEESIAPNQWGEGRPSIAEIWERMRKVEERPDVAWVRVVLHPDTDIAEYDGEFVCDIAGESIAICTSAKPEDIETMIDCESLRSDGVISHFEPYEVLDVPHTPEGYKVLQLVWD